MNLNTDALIEINHEMRDMEKEIAHLRRALRKYGYHKDGCPGMYGAHKCDCGFDKALRKGKV